MNRLLTVDELCEILNCKKSFIDLLVHERQIPYVELEHKTLRFDVAAIEAWLQSRELEMFLLQGVRGLKKHGRDIKDRKLKSIRRDALKLSHYRR